MRVSIIDRLHHIITLPWCYDHIENLLLQETNFEERRAAWDGDAGGCRDGGGTNFEGESVGIGKVDDS